MLLEGYPHRLVTVPLALSCLHLGFSEPTLSLPGA